MTLYALGDRSMRSSDGGRTWTDLDWPAGAHALAIALQPTKALYLWASGTDGDGEDRLFVSEDDGASWTDDRATALAGEMAIVDQPDGPVFLALPNGHLVRSTDEGKTWGPSSVPPGPDALPVPLGGILVSSEASPVVYVQSESSPERVVLVSTDAGATFVAKPLPSDNPLSLDCRGRLYTLKDNAVYRSSDAGTTWEAMAGLDADISSFRVAPAVSAACGDTVYATGEVKGSFALWRLDEGSITRGDLPQFGELADLGEDRLLLAATFGNRQRSDDGGRTWWAAGSDLSLGNLVVSPSSAGTLFVSTVAGRYRSDDEGKTWQWLPRAGINPQDLYPDAHDANVLYARSIYGEDAPWSFISTDRGASFQAWPVPSAAQPEIPEAIASTPSNQVMVFTRGGAYVTDDAGAHFTTLFSVPARQEAMWAAISSSDPPALYAYIGGDDAVPGHVVASLDGGETWSSGDPGTYITNLVIDPADPQVVFARAGRVDESGLLRTLDAGHTWERIAVEGELYLSVYFDPQPPHALYAAGQRLYKSENHGDTWRTVTDLPANQRDFALDLHAARARYVLSERGLLYKMTE